jgi:mRNA-degrading endonuclease toxin of MazEF toxin-antitoxin module
MKRGDVILCKFPHASHSASKLRPALVIQSDYYNQRIANLLVAGFTSNLTNLGDRAHYLVEIATQSGSQSGLSQDSLVSCINLAVIPPRNVERKIGELPNLLMAKVDEFLKFAMGLP